jgi:hypothetical protein
MSRSLRTILNESNPNKLPTAGMLARLGDFLARMPRTRRFAVSSNKIVLPDDAKAEQILNCYVTAGNVSGRFTPAYDSTPATTVVSTNAQGDIVFLSTDAVTEAEVTYLPFEGAVYEETLACAASLFTPSASRRILCVLEAEAIDGSVEGVKTVVDRAASPATTQAALNLLGTGVQFNNGTDAVTIARVKYIATPGFGDQPSALGVNLDSESQVL